MIYHTSKLDKDQIKKEGGNESNHLPAQVVTVWEPKSKQPLVNLKVNADGPSTLWRTSVKYGSEPGQWSWSE